MDEQIYHVARSARLKAVAAVLFPIVICAIDPVPDLYPPRTRDLTLHRPGLTPADEANSAGVMNPRDV
jgi:hypothetical protein